VNAHRERHRATQSALAEEKKKERAFADELERERERRERVNLFDRKRREARGEFQSKSAARSKDENFLSREEETEMMLRV